MQPIIEAVRAHLLPEQVQYLIESAPGITVGKGLELTDLEQSDVLDISEDFLSGTVERSAYATLHGTANLRVSRPIPFGYAVLRPYMTISDGVQTARFNLGAYFTNTPVRPRIESPATREITCFDLLYRLDTVVGDAYSITKGDSILSRVEDILLGRGYRLYVIDQTRADAVAPDSRTWALDQAVTWLSVVNELLGMIGYQGVWSDWNGYLRCERYQRPIERAAEWYLSTDSSVSILGAAADVEFDYHAAPNRWVGIRQNNPEDTAPVEGAGVYTLQNDSFGPTSIDARGGLVLTRQEGFDVATQADLVSQVEAMADADSSVPTSIATTTAPLPLAWHFDRYLLNDPAIGPPSEVLGTQWSLPLDGGDMTHVWTVLSGVEQ